jgi:hypothetical protein
MVRLDPNKYTDNVKKSERRIKAEQFIKEAIELEQYVVDAYEAYRRLENKRNILLGCASHYWDIANVSKKTGISIATIANYKQLYFKEMREQNKSIPVIKKRNNFKNFVHTQKETVVTQ